MGSTVLIYKEETVIVVFRKHTLLGLDNCLHPLKKYHYKDHTALKKQLSSFLLFVGLFFIAPIRAIPPPYIISINHDMNEHNIDSPPRTALQQPITRRENRCTENCVLCVYFIIFLALASLLAYIYTTLNPSTPINPPPY